MPESSSVPSSDAFPFSTLPSEWLKHCLLSVEEMKRADQLTIAKGVWELQLMQNAGEAVAEEISLRWKAQPVTVLCGTGNNGGDGFVVAESLRQRGWKVRVILIGTREKLAPSAAYFAKKFFGTIETFQADCSIAPGVVVDAIFGTGLNRPLDGYLKDFLSNLSPPANQIVAVDIPSGISGLTGGDFGATACQLTVTFFRKKYGHLLEPGKKLCGEVVVKQIGIDDSVLKEIQPKTFCNHPQLWSSELPRADEHSHKYSRGHVGIVGGSTMTGAGRLAARAASRIGAGLTSVIAHSKSALVYQLAQASCIVRTADDIEQFKSMTKNHRFDAMLIGPGYGVDAELKQRVCHLLSLNIPLVIDADAITVFKDDSTSLIQAMKSGNSVLTPHDGEYKRLFSKTGDHRTCALDAATLANAVVLVKGSDTAIASPEGFAIINDHTSANLATGGSGDVLSGMIAGLLAQHMQPFLATAAAVWIHGECGKRFGRGLIADDLPDILPQVLQSFVLPVEPADSQ